MSRCLPFVVGLLLAIPAAVTQAQTDAVNSPPPAALDFTMETLDGEPVELAEKYAGKVVLFVNVASKCGFTKQYDGLQDLHAKYGDQGLVVVGVPCNQFGGQEPGTADEIAQFCSSTYGVEFDMLGKVEVNGEGQCPLYAYLTKESPYPGPIKWNFEKFLIGRDGEVTGRYASRVTPDSVELVADIEHELAKDNE
ncbi:Hydroperoxy fatty acid reductase gpx1 [Botrimarina colliarenosi]|uniref:Glutathione peroxidase n=1 Tax=Botrimarina colliarenosi TaxID=2528001 RepID=A0A5C6AKZ6_9BACT|nr:Hydroperoxy fatty acid reductase gpx1 [Botrimarina colliarenosi]